jgi:predicted MFS family arabinose efflux permease
MSTVPRSLAPALFASFGDRTVLGLGLTQTIGYGTLYYAYGVLAPAISSEFGVSIDWFFGALTVGLLLGGVVAPIVGRELDRHGAQLVMTVGSIAAALALTACAFAPNLWLFATAIVLAEAATCLVVYEAAFAGLTQIYRHEARGGITAVTLMAGFASTIFWPLTQWMLTTFEWRSTLAIFAAVHLLVCAPLHFAILRRAVAGQKKVPESRRNGDVDEPPVLLGLERRRALVFYTAAVVVSGLVYAAFPVHMLRIIENEGFTAEAAALIAMVMGPAQVLARLVELLGGHRFDPLMTGRVALGALLVAIALLLLTPGSAITAIVFAALYGSAQGLMTIARATVPLQLFGTRGYATLVGRITGIRFLANAASPFLFALAMTSFSVDMALSISSICAAIAFAAILKLRPPAGVVGRAL